MSNHDSPWSFSTIGKELHIINGFGFKPEQWKESGIPIIRIENLNDRFAAFNYVEQIVEGRFRVETGDLLFAWSGSRGTSFGPFIWDRGDAVLNQHIFNVRSKHDGLNKQFCYWWLKFLVAEIEQQAHGSAGLVHITRKELEKFRFPLLPPHEQCRIAEILSTVDETIEQTEVLIAKYQQIKAGLMDDLFTRGVTPDGKLRPTRAEAPQLYKESPLGWIPKEWEGTTLSRLYSEPSRNGLYKPAASYGRGHLMVHMPQMFRSAVVDLSDAARVQVEGAELGRFGLREDDLLFARRSLTLEGAGRCSLVPKLLEPTTFESSIIRVRLNQALAVSAYVNCYLSSAIAYRFRLRVIRQVAVSGVAASDLLGLPIPRPDPSEQTKIVEMLTAIESQIEMEKTKSLKLSMKKHGLMHDLLTGRVRVTVCEARGTQI